MTASRTILLVTRPLCAPWDEASKNFAYDLAKNLQHDHVTILTKGHVSDVPDHITQKDIYTKSAFTLVQKMRLVFYLLCHAKEFEIVHLLFTPTKINVAILKAILPSSCTVIQTLATLREDLYSHEKLLQMLFGDVIVTYSDFTKTKVQSITANTKVSRIYPGIDLSKFVPTPKDNELMQSWKIAPNDIVVAYPGEYARLGATDLLVDTFLELWEDPAHHHIKYLCACRIKNDQDRAKKQRVMDRFKRAGHSDKVIYTDTYGDMNKIYNLSDIVLFPVQNMRGKFDVPLAMIEPYACKKPVIASDLPLFKEFSSDTFNVIIPTGDREALVTAIAELSTDAERRKEYGNNAHEFAHKTFNISAIASQYEELYKKL